MIGHVVKAIHGTRGAPQSWQHHVSGHLRGLDSVSGVNNPCVFFHPTRSIHLTMQVEDFLISAEPDQLE